LTLPEPAVVNRTAILNSVRPLMNLPLRRAGRSALMLAVALFTTWIQPAHAADKERDDCARNLQTIWNAIQKYREGNKDLPLHLSSLVPKELSSPNALVCPVTRRTGEIKNRGFSDPGLSTSYIYEFGNQPAPVTNSTTSATYTLRDWRQLQMGRVGSIVPILRCLHHDRVLNMSFDGKLYETTGDWEAELASVIDPQTLSPNSLFEQVEFFATGVRAARMKTIDLAQFHTAELTEPLQETRPNSPSLARFPKGRSKFNGVPFEVTGVIQLRGTTLQQALPDRYPVSVNGIEVNQRAASLHFLIGTGWNLQGRRPIGYFQVHYEDGETARIPLVYNQHVSDWWNPPPADNRDLRVAWVGPIGPGANNVARDGHVYQFAWNNTRAQVPIATLDFVSEMTVCAPFLLGLSVEQP